MPFGFFYESIWYSYLTCTCISKEKYNAGLIAAANLECQKLENMKVLLTRIPRSSETLDKNFSQDNWVKDKSSLELTKNKEENIEMLQYFPN